MASSSTDSDIKLGQDRKGQPDAGSYDPSREEKAETLNEEGVPGADDYPEGGTRAWMVAAGTAGMLFSTLGMANSFGVFQAYYMTHQLQNESPDNISWIGGLQVFFVFAAGIVGGPLFDRFGAWVMRPAAVVYIFAIMMTSLCTEYWQLLLAQGILTGFSCGLVMSPGMAATSQYFHKRRGAAIGIAITGSSFGAVVFPLILAKMLNESSIGFGWSVRIIGFILIPVLTFSSIAIKARLPPRQTRFLLPSAFKKPLYNLLIAGQFTLMTGMFTPLFYLPSYAESNGMNPTLAGYLIAMLNGASAFGRVIPGILADKLGRLNMLAAMGFATGIIILCWTKVEGTAGTVVYAVAFGFASGALASGGIAALSLCPDDPRDIGTYLGMGMAISAFSALLGPPVTGAMLKEYHGFLEISIFGGVLSLAGASMVVVGKFFTKEGIFGKV